MAFISEVNFRGTGVAKSGEFVEIVLEPGEDPADYTVSVYREDGTLHTGADIAGGEVNLSTLTGTPHPDDPAFTVYVIPVGLRNAASDRDEGTGIALTNVDTPEVISFYSADNVASITATEGAATGASSDNFLEHLETDPGESYQFDLAGNITIGTADAGDAVICLTNRGRVLTRTGRVAAERLKVGDEVWTLDHGFQPILWIGKSRVSPAMMRKNPKLRPFRLDRDSLAPGSPATDLLLSRQHRVMLASDEAEALYDTREVLIAAHRLDRFDGIAQSLPDRDIVYVHVLFHRHEVVDCDGALVESLLLTNYSAARAQDLPGATGSPALPGAVHAIPARPLVEGKTAHALLARLQDSAGPLLDRPGPSDHTRLPRTA